MTISPSERGTLTVTPCPRNGRGRSTDPVHPNESRGHSLTDKVPVLAHRLDDCSDNMTSATSVLHVNFGAAQPNDSVRTLLDKLCAEQRLPSAILLPDEILKRRRPFRPHRTSGFVILVNVGYLKPLYNRIPEHLLTIRLARLNHQASVGSALSGGCFSTRADRRPIADPFYRWPL